MASAAQHLVGRHDFDAYRATSCQAKQSIRELRQLRIRAKDHWIWIDAEADGFLKHMVRNIVGVLLAIGSGERSPLWAKEVLEGRDRALGGVTARPDGLYFTGAYYSAAYGLASAPGCRFW